MASASNGSTWWHQVEPIFLPLLKLAAPIALRIFLTWYAHRAPVRVMSRRERILAWCAAFAAAATIHSAQRDVQAPRDRFRLGR